MAVSRRGRKTPSGVAGGRASWRTRTVHDRGRCGRRRREIGFRVKNIGKNRRGEAVWWWWRVRGRTREKRGGGTGGGWRRRGEGNCVGVFGGEARVSGLAAAEW
jgi:hypothetical protein